MRGRSAGLLVSLHQVTPLDLVRIGPDDWREFREVRLASLQEAPRAFGSRYQDWVDAPEGRWRARLTDVPLTVVARGGEGPVGVVSGADSEGEVELISMWVSPDQRGTGLAGRLIEQVVGWATERGRRTYLMVRDDNVAAISAYERAGFVDDGVPADWPADEPPERRMWHVADAGGST